MGYVEALLAENEQIIVRTRQHWMVWARSLIANSILLALIVALALVAAGVLGLVGLLATILFIVPVTAFTRDFMNWWNEEYLVTNRRVIQSEGVINKHVIDSSLEKINDVVLKQSLFGRLFDYGDIEILTASEYGVNRLRRIVSPIKFKTEMLNQKGNYAPEDRRASQGGQGDIPKLIAELDRLRKQGALTDAEFQDKKTRLLSKLQ